MNRRWGFTLVELMVVITIAVLLLALLAPALDRALYQAELAVCSSNLSNTAKALVTYAASHHRRYPHRQGVTNGEWEAHKIAQALPNASPIDERPALKGFLNLKLTLDPLCEKIGIAPEETDSDDIVFRNSDQWAGFQWFGHQGMMKLGDRLTWTDEINPPLPKTYRFRLLASDRDFINIEQRIVDSSHPDEDGLLWSRAWQSEDVSGGFGLLADTILKATYSGWYRTGDYYRGKSDLNYAYDDGSVQRFDGVLYKGDPRMTPVPHFANITGVPTVGSWPSQFDNLPKP